MPFGVPAPYDMLRDDPRLSALRLGMLVCPASMPMMQSGD
jgi:hypothetical protein